MFYNRIDHFLIEHIEFTYKIYKSLQNSTPVANQHKEPQERDSPDLFRFTSQSLSSPYQVSHWSSGHHIFEVMDIILMFFRCIPGKEIGNT